MDFSQFLVQNPGMMLPKTNTPKQNCSSTALPEGKEQIKKEKDTKPKEQKQPIKKLKDNTFHVKLKNIIEEEPPMELQYQEFKRGDFVTIQRLENSDLNIYKGYFGQIKEYRQISNSAYVILEAMNYPIPINFPAGHLVHRTKFFAILQD
jgi:hypothetical protein